MRISKKIATAAAALAIAAGLLAPTASAACPYTVGPLGRYIAPAEVRGLYAYGDRVQLVVNANGTPGDFSDDTVEDVFWSCCSIDD